MTVDSPGSAVSHGPGRDAQPHAQPDPRARGFLLPSIGGRGPVSFVVRGHSLSTP
jgi:hypothetical protein